MPDLTALAPLTLVLIGVAVLAARAMRDTKNRAGETAADLARKREYGEIVKLLEAR